jgi:antitoxin (DNA-binding transcriptional repressor) of toxin-antitoxin stability system
MGSSVTISEARATLPAIVERVMTGEEVTLTRHGQPVAVVVRPDALRVRRAGAALADAAALRDALEHGRRARLSTNPVLSEERADALLEAVRAGRSGR